MVWVRGGVRSVAGRCLLMGYCVFTACATAVGAWMGGLIPLMLWGIIATQTDPERFLPASDGSWLLFGGFILAGGAAGATVVRRCFYLHTRWLNMITGALAAGVWLYGTVTFMERSFTPKSDHPAALWRFFTELDGAGLLLTAGTVLVLFAPWDCLYRWARTRSWQSPGFTDLAADIDRAGARLLAVLFSALGSVAFMAGLIAGGLLMRVVLDGVGSKDFVRISPVWDVILTLGTALVSGFGMAWAVAEVQQRVTRRIPARLR